MGRIVKAVEIDLKALEAAMQDVGTITGKNGEEWSAGAAFVEADVKDGEDYSGVLIFVPGICLDDLIEDQPNAEERAYYDKLMKEEGR